MVTSMGTALVIDDSRAIRMILGRTLNRFGYEVCSAANGREALDMIGQQDLALSVILGVVLGGISGYVGGRTDQVIQRLIELLQSVLQ